MTANAGKGLFNPDHPRRLIPELSTFFHRRGWFVGTGCGGFISIKQGDSIYVAPSNVVKNRIAEGDLFMYKIGDSSVSLSPDQKLVPCEMIGLILLVFKERKGTGAVLHSNGKEPCLASLIYTQNEFRIKNQAVIKSIYNNGLKRYYNIDEELTVPIINHSTEAELRKALKKYPHTNAVIVRNQGMFVWGETWQKCQSMTESYHFLMDIAVQMEKLGVNVYTHNTTCEDIIAVNDSVNSSMITEVEEKPLQTTRPVTEKVASKPVAAIKDEEPPTATPPSPSKSVNGKKPSAASTNVKTSPLKKTSGGKVVKTTPTSGAKTRGRGQANKRGKFSGGLPGPNIQGYGLRPVPPMGMMMGPGPMGPPMGMMGPMMGPMPSMGPMMPPHMQGAGRGNMMQGRRGRGRKKAGASGKKQNNKAGVAKDILMNY